MEVWRWWRSKDRDSAPGENIHLQVLLRELNYKKKNSISTLTLTYILLTFFHTKLFRNSTTDAATLQWIAVITNTLF